MSSMAHEADPRAGMVLRDMSPADVPAVAALERAAYTMPWSEATFRGLIRRRDAEMITAEAGGAVVGYAAFWCVVDQGELGNVCVSDEWRSHGLGSRLVEEVIRRAAQRGVHEVFLEVRPSNGVARRLYERLGFRPVGRRRDYYQAPAEDAIVLRHLVQPL
ncbi:MAG: ribosomal protein S18-alanine N-acetyltransferase [Gemmatimonadetes bacterium]|nr:ribosomal protein S18-alanine N-acetyltransferase [Gemmatimonadota bacterium]